MTHLPDDYDDEAEQQLRDERARQRRVHAVNVVVAVVRAVAGFAAVILVAYIVLTLGNANPGNSIARFVHSSADVLALGFHDLFTPRDPRLAVVINYGLAALFWLAAAALITRALRRLTSPYVIS